MKIAIITFHAPQNCGAFLQAYALQTYLCNNLMLSADILNYRTKRQQQLSSVFLPLNSVTNLVKNVIFLPHYKKLKEREAEFLSMQNTHLHLTRALPSFQSFKQMYDEYDLFISGSDQIWNGTLNGFSKGGQEPYYLKDCHKRKISYASSLGPKDTPAVRSGLEQNIESLREYEAISVRETLAKNILQEYIDRPVQIVLDPVFLLDKEAYQPLFNSRLTPKCKYILLYSVNYPGGILRAASTLASKTNLPVLVPYAGRRAVLCQKYGFQILYNAGPGCFLDLLYNAEFVLTDSFHGTAFSILFDKNFLYCPPSVNSASTDKADQKDNYTTDDRIRTLLDSVGLSHRYLTDLDNIDLPRNPYPLSGEKMVKEIAAAKAWLQHAIFVNPSSESIP
ncbi:MAG: polysaccharide pyruvyl transferase family protein [Lachnospiraceae bacterium]|nr:polysaccharide pyruvyl transferase family protein [Lachnospiraceae bacterium]